MKHGQWEWAKGAGGLTLAKLESWQQKHYFSLGLHFYRHLWGATAVSCRRGTRGNYEKEWDGKGREREFKRDFCSLIMRPSRFIGSPFYWTGVCYHYSFFFGGWGTHAIFPSHKYDHNELMHHSIGTNANRVRRAKNFLVSRQNENPDRRLQIEADSCTWTDERLHQ